MPLAAISRIRRALRGAGRPRRASAKPLPPVAARAGTRIRRPQGIDVFTRTTASREPVSSVVTVAVRKARMVRIAIPPAAAWTARRRRHQGSMIVSPRKVAMAALL
jgi:hypothetical protein